MAVNYACDALGEDFLGLVHGSAQSHCKCNEHKWIKIIREDFISQDIRHLD
jgi:hypothetical protein